MGINAMWNANISYEGIYSTTNTPIDTNVWSHHLDFYEMFGEKAR